MRIRAYFYGGPGDSLDKACSSIFEARAGRSIGAGTMLVGDAAGERDVEYDIPDDRAEECKRALRQAGFRLEPTPSGPLDAADGIPDDSPPTGGPSFGGR